MTKPPRPSLFLYYWTFFISVCLIVGCYTQKKAEKDQSRVILNHRTVAARAFLKEFPMKTLHDTVFTTGFDSLDFVKARDEAVSGLRWSNKSIDSLRNIVNSMSEGAREVCYDILEINDYLLDENEKMTKAVARLKNLPAKIEFRDRETVKMDSALYFLAQVDRDNFKELYAIDHDYRVRKEKKEKGSLAIYIPWWILIVLGIGVGVMGFTKFKTKSFNPLKLIK